MEPKASRLTPDELEQQTSSRWMLWAFCSLFAVAVLWWAFFDKAAVASKHWWGRRYIPEIKKFIQLEDWRNAATSLVTATRWAPDDPEVLRVAVDFATHTGSEPRTMIRFLTRLDQLGEITVAERCTLGRMYVKLPDLKSAHEIYDAVPQGELSKRPALELLSAIQKAEGMQARSFLTQRQALLADPDNPEAVLQLALLDARSGDASLSGPARDRLWPIAKAGDANSIPAIEYLAQHQHLGAQEAESLMEITRSLPDGPKSTTVRLEVLSAVLRLNPHRRQEILNAELQRWSGKPLALLEPLLGWLVKERESERLFRIVSAKTASIYGAVLPHYVNALRQDKKWSEVSKLVTGRVDPGFSRAQLRLWLAEAQSHLSEDPSTARQILTSLFDESGHGESEELAIAIGQMAEQIGYWDIARRSFEGAAERHIERAITFYLKAYDMAMHEVNGKSMLAISEKLCALKVTDLIFVDRVNYLRLVMGTSIEVAQRDLETAAAAPAHHITADRKIALSLLRAILAYRERRFQEIRGHLDLVRDIDTFPPGPRAVYAGLLAVSGDTAGAYRVGENIPQVLLLPEERRFLAKAL